MNLNKLSREFGPESQNKIATTNQKSIEGALAGLESFYYGFNNKDREIISKVWYHNEFVQLNNPLGGIVRGIDPIIEMYDKIFNGGAKVWVRLTDVIYYAVDNMIIFTGTEIGEFSTNHQTIPLKIRTSRIFGYLDENAGWLQLHHHGSIDDADLLHQYQAAVGK